MPKVPGVDHRFVAAGDLHFHVAVAGEGDPVLLVHGWPEHWYAWRDVIPMLAAGHQVLAVDLRGFGWTEIAWRGFELETLAGDLAAVIAALELDRVAVVGHDVGASVGFELAFRHPERVSRLVALASPSPWDRGRLLSAPDLRRRGRSLLVASPLGPVLLRRGLGLASRQVRRLAAGRERLADDDLRIYDRDLGASTRARAGSLLHRALLARELRGRGGAERNLEAPTLVVRGERDRLVAADAFAGAERHAAELRTETLPGAGHYLPEEAPEAVAQLTLDFLDRGGEPAPAAPAGAQG